MRKYGAGQDMQRNLIPGKSDRVRLEARILSLFRQEAITKRLKSLIYLPQSANIIDILVTFPEKPDFRGSSDVLVIMLRVKREKNRPISSITIYKINIKNSNHVGDRAHTEQIECKKRMKFCKRTNGLSGQYENVKKRNCMLCLG